MSSNILLVEDEPAIAEIVMYNLQKEGYSVSWEDDGLEGLSRAQSTIPNLCILDIMLPGIDGQQICRVLKSESKTRPIRIMMLTAKNQEEEEIRAFNMGADDYVTKPFRIRPLIVRIQALLRRPELNQQSRSTLSLHGIEMDCRNYAVSAGGAAIVLTPAEFRVVWTMMSHPGRAFSRPELLEGARWDDTYPLERTIDVHIASIRKRLGSHDQLIETVYGIGYRFRRE